MLDGSLEDESLFGEFLRTPVSEGGVEPLVVGPPHVVVGVAPQSLDRGAVVPVHELLLQQPVRRLDHGVVAGVALARQRPLDAEHAKQLVDSRVVELAAPVGVEHLNIRQREVEGGERGQHQARVPGPSGGMAGDAPVRQVDQQAHVRPVSADADIGQVARRVFLQVGVHSMGTIFRQHRRLVSSGNCAVGTRRPFFLGYLVMRACSLR